MNKVAAVASFLALVPRLAYADAFFCDHHSQAGPDKRSPEVVITSEGESIQRGVEMSVRCSVQGGVRVTLFVKDAPDSEGLSVLRFAGNGQSLVFPLRPSHLGRSFTIPEDQKAALLGLVRSSSSLELEVLSGEKGKKKYDFILDRANKVFLPKLDCL